MNGTFVRVLSGLALALVLLLGWSIFAPAIRSLGTSIAPAQQADLAQDRVYAYRDWQSLGIRLEEGDEIDIRATGSWLYTPGDYHGPEGHPRFSAPSFYPLPGPGGLLIGRIGDNGIPFYIGRQMHLPASRTGILYLGINDDVLSDNDGYVAVDVKVISVDELARVDRSIHSGLKD